jgi:hypothetical protein
MKEDQQQAWEALEMIRDKIKALTYDDIYEIATAALQSRSVPENDMCVFPTCECEGKPYCKFTTPQVSVPSQTEGEKKTRPYTYEQLVNMLEDVVNGLDLSEVAIDKHGPLGTPPAELVKLLLAQKDMEIKLLKAGFVDPTPSTGQPTEEEKPDLGICKEKNCNDTATADYNGHGHYVCDYHNNKLNDYFDEEYK